MAEANWYVVHTYSGYENKVKANIEKTIENRHLEEEILEVRVPMQDVVEMKNGARKTVQKKMFPGYVLINMVMNDDTWYVVRNTRGVTGFVGPGSKPVPLSEAEMKPLGIKVENISVDFKEGDTIAVVAGVWKDTVGVVAEDGLQQTDSNHQCRTVRQGNTCRDQLRRSKTYVLEEPVYAGLHETFFYRLTSVSRGSRETCAIPQCKVLFFLEHSCKYRRCQNGKESRRIHQVTDPCW